MARPPGEVVEPLQSCTWYHFAARITDDNSNLGALHPEVKAKTLCPGGGGGGGGVESDLTEVVRAGSGEAISSHEASRPGGLSTQADRGTDGALVVETEVVDSNSWRFTLRSVTQTEGAEAGKVLIQEKDASDEWATRTAIQPLAGDGRLGICPTSRPGRRLFPGSWELTEIAPLLTSPAGDLALASAQHTSGGDVATAAWGGDGAVSLLPGETLTLLYERSDLVTEAEESWFALVERSGSETTTARDPSAEAGDPAPQAFALHQNQPNPFHHTTNIRFDLPKQATVQISVFDIAGRKVRTLVSGSQPAGRHSVEWNHRDDAGVRLGPGAYIYRLHAGDFREERKMILLP